jgi:hypothetical protein
MLMHAFTVKTFAVLSVAAAAIATSTVLPATAQGTQAQRMACMSDAMSLCSADIPNTARIAACLRREQARVSPGCVREMNLAVRSASLKQ